MPHISSFLTIKSGEKRNSGGACRLLSKTYKMKKPTLLGRCSTVDVFPLLDGYEAIPAPTAEYMTALSDFWHLLIYLKSGPYSNQNTIAQSWSLANGS